MSLNHILLLAIGFGPTGPSSGNIFWWNLLHCARMSIVFVDVRRHCSEFEYFQNVCSFFIFVLRCLCVPFVCTSLLVVCSLYWFGITSPNSPRIYTKIFNIWCISRIIIFLENKDGRPYKNRNPMIQACIKFSDLSVVKEWPKKYKISVRITNRIT
jgi:hypothetical protein